MKKILIFSILLIGLVLIVGCAQETASEQAVGEDFDELVGEGVEEDSALVGEASYGLSACYERVSKAVDIIKELKDDVSAAQKAFEAECGDVFEKKDTFMLGGTPFEYKGADKQTATSPKIKFKNYKNGETYEYSVDPSGEVDFTLKIEGVSYPFASASDPTQNDFDIEYDCVGPCDIDETLQLGESDTYTTGSKSYEVVFDDLLYQAYAGGIKSVDLVINGEEVSVMEGETVNLADGSSLTLSNIIYQAYAGGIKAAQFCING